MGDVDGPPETAETSDETHVLDPPAPDSAQGRRLRWLGLGAAAVAVGFMWLDERFAWLEYQPGGTAFFTYVRPVFYVLLVAGALLALRWEVVGAFVAAFAAGAIGAFAVNQLRGRDAMVVVVLLSLPAVIWVLSDLIGWSRRWAAVVLAAVVLAGGVGSFVGESIYERFYGPTHPASEVAELPDSAVRWVWSGGVTQTSARVRTRLESAAASQVRLAVSDTGDLADARFVAPDDVDGPLVGFVVDDLRPDVEHVYAVEVDGRVDTTRAGRFRTFPDGPASFTFTVGACARVGSNGAVFDAIRTEDPLVHLIAGDFHYGDIPDDDRERFDEVIDLTLRRPGQAALYRTVPVAYVWDDHDYGVNDSDATSRSRQAAMAAYRANVPSYHLAGPESAVYQSFDVGRVRFLLTDARAAREPGTMYGPRQLSWFLDALVTASEERALVVWLNPVPWVAEEDPDGDHWGGYADERRRIADTIAQHGIDNLLMVSGDAHMVAIDDGTNTDYSAEGEAGFPLLHAAALDRPGGVKGGPYSHGAIGGSGQYGVVDVVDDGDSIDVTLRAMKYDGEQLLRYEFSVAE